MQFFCFFYFKQLSFLNYECPGVYLSFISEKVKGAQNEKQKKTMKVLKKKFLEFNLEHELFIFEV